MPFIARLGKGNERVNAKGFCFRLACETVVAAPVFGAVGVNQQKKPLAIEKLVGRGGRLGSFDLGLSQKHEVQISD